MLLFYIRHADPIYSPDSITPLGKRQAEALAKRLYTYGIDKIFSSSSNRAILTATPTSELNKREITVIDFANENYAWREFTLEAEDGRRLWLFQDKKTAELFVSNEVKKLGFDWHEHPSFKGKGYNTGYERIRTEADKFLESLGYKHDRNANGYIPIAPTDERIAIFAHAGFGLAFLSAILDIPYPEFCTRFDLSHSSMTVIEFAGKEGLVIPKMLQLSNDSHLYKEGLATNYNNRIRI